MNELETFQSYDLAELNDALKYFVDRNSLLMVQFLLTSSELKIHADSTRALRHAVYYRRPEILSYVLSQNVDEQSVDIMFSMSCIQGHKDVVSVFVSQAALSKEQLIKSQTMCEYPDIKEIIQSKLDQLALDDAVPQAPEPTEILKL